jgi:hypothetical protein
MKENSIDLKTINDILGLKFYIPSYQRGFRWSDQQVTDLLEDIWEFAQKEKLKDEFYCLQPIIVTEKGDKWELIDGQQRLTSIFIILSFLQKERFEIEFETRPKSKEFLDSLSNKFDDSNIDFFHISKAFELVNNWFNEKEKKGVRYIKDKFNLTLLESTKVIWYQVNDGTDPIGIFTRINIGKIPLTNAELIKALFLKSDNFGKDPERAYLKQIEIASEWDRIEYSLQREDFWYFINKDSNELPTRIEFLFNLMAGKIDAKDEYFTFRYFYKRFNGDAQKNVELVWKEIKDYYMTFEEWFDDPELYHLIGYLITVGLNIEMIKDDSLSKSKSDFKKYINERIKLQVNFPISDLEYGSDNQKISKVLLLFNLVTLINNQDSNSRFPFDRFKKEKWSIEHIHAQNSDGLVTIKQWNAWLSAHADSLNRIDFDKYSELIEEIKKLNDVNITKDIFDDLFTKVLTAINSNDDNDDLHDIRNLALLDRDSNSALNKSIFEIKPQSSELFSKIAK